MKKYAFVIALLTVIVIPVLAGCAISGTGKPKTTMAEARKLAEEHAEKLRAAVNDDSIRFTDDRVGEFGNDMYTFTLWTDKYDHNFCITVNAGMLSDSYGAASVYKSAVEEWDSVLGEFTGYKISYEVDTKTGIVSSALTSTEYDSIYDAQKAYGDPSLVKANITFNDDEYRNQERIYCLLQAISIQGLIGEVSITGEEYDYEVADDGIYIWRATGADGGHYIERMPFSPDVE